MFAHITLGIVDRPWAKAVRDSVFVRDPDGNNLQAVCHPVEG